MTEGLFYPVMYRAAIDGLRITDEASLNKTESGLLVLSQTREAEFNMSFILKMTPSPAEVQKILDMIKESKRPSVLYANHTINMRPYNSDSHQVEYLERRNIMDRTANCEELVKKLKSRIIQANAETDQGRKAYADAKDVMAKGFEFENPEDVQQIMQNGVLNNPEVSIYCSYLEDMPIGTLTTVKGFADNLWNLTVLKEHRKKGFGSELINFALQTNRQQSLIANEDAFPFYIANGFTTKQKLKTWTITP